LWRSVSCLEIPIGKVSEEEDESSNLLCSSIGEWLLGYEFIDTLLVIDFTPNNEQIIFLTSSKKVTYLNDLKANMKNVEPQAGSSSVLPKNIEVLDRKNTSLEDVLSKLKKMGKKVGVVESEKKKHLGKFVKEWYTAFDKEVSAADKSIEQVDVENALHDILSIKSQQELGYVTDSSKIVSRALEKIFKQKMETIIDEDKQITHAKLASSVEEAIVGMKLKKKNEQDDVEIESPFMPVIQSGGRYDLKIHAANDTNNLHCGTICCILGAKFKAYCSTIARTYMIDASKQQTTNYQLLLEIYKMVIRKLKPGVELSRIYESALDIIRKKNPALEKHFLPSVGYGIGLAPQDDYMSIGPDNRLVAEKGMSFVVFVGFQDVDETAHNKITDEKRKKYSLVIGDTVILPLNEVNAKVLTTGDLDYDDVSYSLEDEHEEKPAKSKKPVINIEETEGPTSRTRDRKTVQANGEDERRRKLDELIKRKSEESRNQKSTGKGKSKDKESYSIDAKLAKGDIFSYKSPLDYPTAKHNKILVDKKRDTVLLPINGTHVPFHIATIKNVAKTDEADCMHLRINFKNSKANFGKPYAPAKMFPETFFIKELSYRSKDPRNLTLVMRDILDLRKKISDKEKDINENRKEFQKGDLVLTKGVRPPKLIDLYMRPGKKAVGTLEAHENGLRFVAHKGERVDILYGNIKNAFFQAAQKDLIVLIHFHLHSPIMIGKKAQYDIQFYTDVTEEFDHLVGKYRRTTTDSESIEEEYRERQLKKKLNDEFAAFAKKVEEKSNMEFDIPYRDLEFTGTPFRSNVNLVPTVNCLVSLTEAPFFVLTLDEVEMVVFERISFGLKNFDMVFVMKDYSKPVATINCIPTDKLETLKDWLLQVDIVYFESKINLVWSKIIKIMKADPEWNPWGEGGWSQYLGNTDDVDDDDEPQEEDYQPESASEGEDYSSDEYESDDFSDEYESEYESDESEEEGEDWDTLLKKAHASDEKKRDREEFSDDEDQPKSKRPRNGPAPTRGAPGRQTRLPSNPSARPRPGANQRR